jgi:hypothetical protein
VEGAAEFVRIVDYVAGLPLTLLGLTIVAAAVAFGWPTLAVTAAAVTMAMLVALREDVRLHKALELLGRGEVQRAERALEEVANSSRRSRDQRQRARGHLASIAWRRGDLDGALHWTRARIRSGPGARSEARDDRYLAAATEVQLLALAGDASGARQALAGLPAPPPGPYFELVAMTTELLVGFVARELEVGVDRLASWEARARESDGLGTALILVAWAWSERGDATRATALLGRARAHGDPDHVRRHYPVLSRWAETFGARTHYARG